MMNFSNVKLFREIIDFNVCMYNKSDNLRNENLKFENMINRTLV